jgi:hypothetical protein
MKLNPILPPLLLPLFTTLVAADPNQQKCAHDHPRLAQTIAQFCNVPGNNLMVPSVYANNGRATSNHGKFHVMISSNCNPQMWVPQYWCEKQFYEICAEFDGIGNKRYGPGGCQLFNIY